MKITRLKAAVLGAFVALAPLVAKAIEVERFGLYVVSEDLPRSEAFYSLLFGVTPRVRTPGLVGFDVGGGFYAVVSKNAYAPTSTRGATLCPTSESRTLRRSSSELSASPRPLSKARLSFGRGRFASSGSPIRMGT